MAGCEQLATNLSTQLPLIADYLVYEGEQGVQADHVQKSCFTLLINGQCSK